MSSTTPSVLWYLANNLSTAHWLIDLGVALFFSVILIYAFLVFFLRKEIRLFRNLRRPIMIIFDATRDISSEVSLLRKTRFFKIEEPTMDVRQADEIGNHSLIIVGYVPKMAGFADIVSAARNAKVPLIVYTHENMDEEDRRILMSYSWHSMCNVPLRLINDTFAILSTFPKMK